MRLLIVEDEPVMRAALERGLAAHGFVVEVADNGVDGLWLAREGDFDLVILDVMLPGLSGDEVCRELRRDGSSIPVLVLTARSDELDEARGLDGGADDFLAKPFSFVVLLARIRALLRRSNGSPGPVLRSGDLALDPAGGRCWVGGDEVSLTSREFALIEFLLHRKGQTVSRNAIAAHVWDADLDIDSNVIEVYIGYLRRKLDQPGSESRIRTIRGMGYRLLEQSEAGGVDA